MRIVFVGNNYLGWQVFKRLVDGKEDIIGLVLHPDEKSAYKSHILETARDTSCFVWDAPSLKNPVYLKKLKELEPDLILSVLFGYILKKNVLEIPKQGCINIHNGYLPYNKGVNANIWSIIDGTPAGGTIHFMDEGIDTGDIIARREVPVLFSDTGKTLYKKTEEACISLFEETWDSIKSGTMQRTPQDQKKGTFHAKAHLSNLDRIFPDNMYKGQELVDIIRARTPPLAAPTANMKTRNISWSCP